MSMSDQNDSNPDHAGDHGDLTQGENPGAQGDIGAGQAQPDPIMGDPLAGDPTVGDGDDVEGTDQPRIVEESPNDESI